MDAEAGIVLIFDACRSPFAKDHCLAEIVQSREQLSCEKRPECETRPSFSRKGLYYLIRT